MWGQYYCYTQIVILKMKEERRVKLEKLTQPIESK